jgi:hypothetical protein
LISSLNRALFLLAITALLLSACAGQSRPDKPLRLVDVQIQAQGTRALLDELQWVCVTENGVGPLTYQYLTRRAGVTSSLYRGPAAQFRWSPKRAGEYQLKVIVRDSAGSLAEGDWSPVYRFSAPVDEGQLIAVWPVDNLSANQAPLGEIREELATVLQHSGLTVLEETAMERFMRDNRIRHIGGLSRQISERLAEIGVAAVVLPSLETWSERGVPRVSLMARLVVTGQMPEIAWVDSVGLTGDDQTGLLGIGRINDPLALAVQAVERLGASLRSSLRGDFPAYRHSVTDGELYLVGDDRRDARLYRIYSKPTHRPRTYFRDQQFDPSQQYRLAMVPFLNVNARKNSGRIVALHLLQQLQRYDNIRVYEPGVIREVLLRYRMIMQAGPSLAAADILASEKILGADLIMSGKVFDFQDTIGETKVDFSTQIFSGVRREVIWTSHSYAGGNDGVYFFDFGRLLSAHNLLRPMAQLVVKLLED